MLAEQAQLRFVARPEMMRTETAAHVCPSHVNLFHVYRMSLSVRDSYCRQFPRLAPVGLYTTNFPCICIQGKPINATHHLKAKPEAPSAKETLGGIIHQSWISLAGEA
jgi:hypothetical protein